MSEIEKFADKAMFRAAPITADGPKVSLLWMTPDPLGAMAAAHQMYKGNPITDLSQVTDEMRRAAWEDTGKTHLKAPLEFIEMQFMIENVDRAFTHQLVRQRTAVYAQESMRFAVKDNLKDEVSKPPSFYNPTVYKNVSGQNDLFDAWDECMEQIQKTYNWLIAQGVPAEDARGLLPTATPTRIIYKTNLRNLLEHAGNRLCTQAQFHWRTVFMQIRQAIRDHGAIEVTEMGSAKPVFIGQDWQHILITDTSFVPQCYLQGRCTFDSNIDRGCTIRGRVDNFAREGVPSSDWEGDDTLQTTGFSRIDRSEWLNDEQAGFVR